MAVTVAAGTGSDPPPKGIWAVSSAGTGPGASLGTKLAVWLERPM